MIVAWIIAGVLVIAGFFALTWRLNDFDDFWG